MAVDVGTTHNGTQPHATVQRRCAIENVPKPTRQTAMCEHEHVRVSTIGGVVAWRAPCPDQGETAARSDGDHPYATAATQPHAKRIDATVCPLLVAFRVANAVSRRKEPSSGTAAHTARGSACARRHRKW
eukprot:6355821-Prymnesium_polylepis.1